MCVCACVCVYYLFSSALFSTTCTTAMCKAAHLHRSRPNLTARFYIFPVFCFAGFPSCHLFFFPVLLTFVSCSLCTGAWNTLLCCVLQAQSRFSTETRTVLRSDYVKGIGAPDIDGVRCTVWQWFRLPTVPLAGASQG